MQLAGAWLARKDRGLTPPEVDAFERWLGADASHRAAVAQLERTMGAFDRLRTLAPRAGAKPDCDALAPPARAFRRWIPLTVLGLAATVALLFWSGRLAPGPRTWHYATTAEGYHRAALVDGSIVELNADTAVEIEYTAHERRLHLLQGEAHFHVATDPARPFVVRAQSVAVSAVGTAFNVRVAPAGVEVLVTAGRVRVAPPPTAALGEAAASSTTVSPPEIPLLSAGHKVVVPTSARAEPATLATVTPEEMQRALAWQTRVVEFDKTPLEAIVAEFNRQNRQRIVIDDPELRALRIGGNFRIDQPEAFVRLLETSFGVAAERVGQEIVLHRARANSR